MCTICILMKPQKLVLWSFILKSPTEQCVKYYWKVFKIKLIVLIFFQQAKLIMVISVYIIKNH